MKEVTRNFLVGLFILASILVCCVLMVWFGEAPDWLGTADWTLQITGVREIRGIGEGAPVLLNGVEIGRVARVDFANRERPSRGVVIYTKIRQAFSVPRGATAKVYGSTFGLGAGQINIIVEPAPVPDFLSKEGDARIQGEMTSMIGEVLTDEFTSSFKRTVEHIGNLAEATTPVADNLATLLEERSVAQVDHPPAAEERLTANISTMIERIDELGANVNVVLGDKSVQEDVKGVARDLKDASEEIKELITLWKNESQRITDNANAAISQADENLDRAFTRVTEILDRLDETATSLAAVGHQINQGQGTVGRMIYDERLYESAVLALRRATELLERLDRIAGKIERDGYITVGQPTAVGTLTKKFPLQKQMTESR